MVPKQLVHFGGLGLPIEIAPLRSSPNDILNLASVAAFSSEVIDYKNKKRISFYFYLNFQPK